MDNYIKNKDSFLKKHFDLIIILGILAFIIYQNFVPGTWLAGWDNLLPEMNISLNMKRAFFGVWQQYQGLGLVGGMGHITDLVRQLILLPFILILPTNVIRYLWHFSMLVVGTLGIYKCLKRLYVRKRPSNTSGSDSGVLLGTLFYLLNFGTVQYFWPPYEPFSTFWGFFPWLVLAFCLFLEIPSRKNLVFFILINLLAVPSFYVPTLFLVYLICLGIISFSYLSMFKQFSIWFRQVLMRFSIIFFINAFWLLPFLYFVAFGSANPRLSMTNQMASHETFLRNQKRGFIEDFVLLRGYYYDFPDGTQPLMKPWQDHFASPWVLGIGYLFGVLAISGALLFIINYRSTPRKHQVQKGAFYFQFAVLGILFLGMVALLSATPPFSWLNQVFRSSPLINQAFRAPFTKFIVPTAFSMAIMLVYAVQAISDTVKNFSAKMPYVINSFLFVALMVFSLPVFQGNFLYQRMKIKIPSEYFQLMEFLRKQPKTQRIANLPQGGYWGWTFYRWGLRGSGFIWYGIEQPIMDRAFDIWNLKNEQYYWELNYALFKQDVKLLEKVFEKYFIGLIIFDDNIFYPGEKQYNKIALKTRELLEESPRIQKLKNFGKIDVFQFEYNIKPYIVSGSLVSSAPFSFTQKDPVFYKYGNYLIDSKKPDVFYPFAELFTNRFQSEINFEIKETESHWLIRRKLPEYIGSDYQIKAESLYQTISIPATYQFDSLPSSKIEKINLSPKEFINPHHCAPELEGSSIKFKNQGDQLILKARNASLCLNWQNYEFFKTIENPVGVKLEFEYQSLKDEWPQYCFWDSQNETCLNRKDWPPKGFSSTWETVREEFIFDPQKNDLTGPSFILDAYKLETEKQIKYRQIKLTIYHLKQPFPVKEKVVNYTLSREDSHLTINIPKVTSPFYIEDLIERNLYKLKAKSCNPNLVGKHELTLGQEEGKKFVRLNSQSGDSCISWYFPKLPLKLGWLVEVEYRHRKNYPFLTSGLGGLGNYKFFYTKLGKNPDWEKAYFVIPPYIEDMGGITISLSSTSFNHLETINDLATLRIVPFPWDFLKTIRFDSSKIQNQEVIPIKLKNLEDITEDTPEKATIILPHAYDKGWLAFLWGNGKFKILNHLLINNWANGWEIINTGGELKDVKVYLIFLPQLLQYIGFLVLPMVVVYIRR